MVPSWNYIVPSWNYIYIMFVIVILLPETAI